MLTANSSNTRGCSAIASEMPVPSATFARTSRTTSRRPTLARLALQDIEAAQQRDAAV